MRDWWRQFCEINKDIFRWKRENSSYVSLLELLVLAGDIIAAFSPIYVWFLKQTVGRLLPGAKIPDDPPGRIVFMLSVMALLYLILYGVRAPRVLARRAAEISHLQRDKESLVPEANYRDQLAAAVGVRFLLVKTHVQLLNIDGDCRTMQEEAFHVLGLRLKDLVRQRTSSCIHKRQPPNILVSGVPRVVTTKHQVEDYERTRSYHVYFDPALCNTTEPVRLTITEDVEKGFVMARDQFPPKWWTEDQLERVGQLIIEPTDNLVLWVDFPIGYRVPEDDFSIRVSYGRTKTRHTLEEQRLSSAMALTTDFLSTGVYRTSLKVETPLLGLTYMLCWRPL